MENTSSGGFCANDTVVHAAGLCQIIILINDYCKSVTFKKSCLAGMYYQMAKADIKSTANAFKFNHGI